MPTLQTEAKDAVKNLCSLLGSMSSECSSMVDMFFDEIWKMIVAEMVSVLNYYNYSAS
jgi:hypothetical protein